MMTRSGSVDPGMLLWLQTSAGLTADEISDGLEHHSGLIGLSGGLSGDTRELVAAAVNGNQHAELALAVYTLRVRQEIAAAAACLPRLDAVVFTGEIGADQPEIRESVTSGLTVLGLAGDLNPEQDQDAVVSGPTARVPVLLVHPREDRQIAAETRKLVAEDSS
jgi:acetate kinase